MIIFDLSKFIKIKIKNQLKIKKGPTTEVDEPFKNNTLRLWDYVASFDYRTCNAI